MKNVDLLVALFDKSRAQYVSSAPAELRKDLLETDELITEELVATMPEGAARELVALAGSFARRQFQDALGKYFKEIEDDRNN